MNTNEKISVVVPIYNVEEYLPRCLDSIIAQTYTNIEIMLVDDGSPDNAGTICDEYAAKDERIRVFHIPNGGVAKARQLGVENSTGEYIVFVDPDDWLPLDSVEVLYSNMTDDVDLVIGGHVTVFGNKQKINVVESSYLTKERYLSDAISFNIVGYPWGRIFRSSLFNDRCFVPLVRAQDWVMNIELAIRCRSVRIIDKSVYYYLENSKSSTYRNFNIEMNYYKNLCSIVKNILVDNDIYDAYESEYINSSLRVFGNVVCNGGYINNKDVAIVGIMNLAPGCKLSFRNKIFYYSIKYKLVSFLVYVLFHLKNFKWRGDNSIIDKQELNTKYNG